MSFDRLPETVQTLYAELLEQSIHADAAEAAIGVPPGSFVRKRVNGSWRGSVKSIPAEFFRSGA